MIGGAWRDERTSVVPPASPSPVASAAATEWIDLASVTAHELPQAATCPAGTEPNATGPAHRLWPAAGTTNMAFDRQSGQIVAVITFGDQSQTWTFDVCSNTWAQKGAARGGRGAEPGGWPGTLLYDADSDRTVALASGAGSVENLVAWSYDLETDRWVQGAESPAMTGAYQHDGWVPERAYPFVAAYHDPSGLVVVYDGTRAWAYDVETDAWAAVRWEADWARSEGVTPTTLAYDPVRDRIVVNIEGKTLADVYGTEHRTMTLDPVTGSVDGSRPGLGFFCGWASESCGTVFDEGIGRTVWTDGAATSRRGTRRWKPTAPGRRYITRSARRRPPAPHGVRTVHLRPTR